MTSDNKRNRGRLHEASTTEQRPKDKFVVHIQTTGQTVVGLLTPDGNISQKIKLEFEVELTEKSFMEAYKSLRAKVEELQAQVDSGADGGQPQGG